MLQFEDNLTILTVPVFSKSRKEKPVAFEIHDLIRTIFYSEVATGGVLWKKVFLACNFIKKETLAQVFSSEFCEISKNTLFTEHLRATASVYFTQMINCVERYVKHRKFIFLYVVWQIYCNIGRYRYCMSWLWYLLRYHG